MENSKCSETRDRLSELPDSLIFHIFSYLPIIEVVWTTILSKRWEDLWITVPFLNLDDSTIKYFKHHTRAREFINRALILWRGIKILKLKIDFKRVSLKAFVKDIDVWLRFAKDKSAVELEVHLRRDRWQEFLVPRCLYSCSSLEVLSLKGFSLRRHENNAKWDQLKSLTIHVNCGFISPHVISQVLCGSPNLEVFVLSLMGTDDNLCIQSASLKKLTIVKMMEKWPWGNNALDIQSPNLETLEILGLTYGKFSLNAPSLNDVTLGFYGHEGCSYNDDMNKMLEETLRQILPIIRYVERVALSDWCIKVLIFHVLEFFERICRVSPFPNVKFLKLMNANFSKFEQIADLLEMFPKLERLVVIEEKCDEDEDYPQSLKFEANHDQQSLMFEANRPYPFMLQLLMEANRPYSFLLQLRMVEITWGEKDDSIFSFIKILLKYATKLEKMLFRVKGIMPPSRPSISLFSASQKLLRMPRSSPTAQLIFCEHS